MLSDFAGPYSDLSGKGSEIGTRLAVEDFLKTRPDFKIEVITGDHQNKPDAGAMIVRRWLQVDGVDAVVDVASYAHGAHARYMACPAETLVQLPDEISFEGGAAISCGTSTAYGALMRLNMRGGSTLAIFGQGPVGLSTTMLAAAMGMKVIGIDISDERLDLAKEAGASDVVNVSNTDAVRAVIDLTGGIGADYTMDTSGSATGRLSAIQSTRVFGTMAFVGEGGNVTIDVSNDIMRRQLNMIGSWTFSRTGQDDCARFVVKHKLPIDKFITHKFKLEDADAAYKLFDQQRIGKGVLVPS